MRGIPILHVLDNVALHDGRVVDVGSELLATSHRVKRVSVRSQLDEIDDAPAQIRKRLLRKLV